MHEKMVLCTNKPSYKAAYKAVLQGTMKEDRLSGVIMLLVEL